MGKKDFFLEDIALDDFSNGLDVVERPLSDKLFRVLGIIITLGVLIVAGRVAYFDVFHAQEYSARAIANAGQGTILKAPRGIIYDRYGIPLVTNKPTFDVSINLSEILRHPESVDDTLAAIQAIVPFDATTTKEQIRKADLERQAYVPLVKNISLDAVIALKKLDNRAVTIEDGYAREYIDGPMFSHVLGFIGLVTQDDLAADPSLQLNDDIGKMGIEAQYDALLRGTNGAKIQFRDAKGNDIAPERTQEPISGARLDTTLDAELQKVFFTTLQTRLKDLDRTSGVGLALNPQTGEVLSLINFPDFDNNNLTASLFSDPAHPTFNRTISGVYSPGSTIKPLVAFGALEEHVIDPLKSIYSAGYIELPNPYSPDKPSKFLDWKPQGWVNMYSALARSSNVYFYEVGGGFQDQKGLGIDLLNVYWRKFLLDKKTGIDLPGENYGSLPNPDEKEKRTGQIWRIGDTYNVAIGQGDLMITPIELLRYISGVASKGKLPVPFVVKDAKTNSGKIVYEKTPSFDTLEMKNPNDLNEVEQGMLAGVAKDYGTAYMLHTIPMVIAAKTGSAQIQNNAKTNAFVVAYAPVPNPQIAILVLIEDAREGSLNAVPVVRDVLSWYYEHRIMKTASTTPTL
ncbi:MAG: penicillin-binding transpeptidase domain-containing protein [Patescibacteria group bacterium]|nr:penicillin-binding transpeptidase domain-containing protein [Patescibacteria group bacterium]